jgi:flagellin
MATIGTSIAAVSASNYLTINNEALTKSIKRLSSGSRLADPVDDAAGVAVSGNLDARIKRLVAAVEGSQNVISYGQTVDGFLSTLQGIATRMSELAQRATNGAFSPTDRANYQTEYGIIGAQFSKITAEANFNGSVVLSGTAASGITVAIDASGNTDSLSGAYVTSLANASSVLTANGTIATTGSAIAAVIDLTNAISNITTARAQVNSDISKFNFYIANIRTESVNVQAANSRIKDLNVADESTNQAKQSILVQAATAMLSQANTTQNIVLQLLQG